MKRLMLPALLVGALGLVSCGGETTESEGSGDKKEAVETKPASFKVDGMT